MKYLFTKTGMKFIWEVGDKPAFRNLFAPYISMGVEIEKRVNGKIEGKSAVLCIPSNLKVEIKEVIAPDPRIITTANLHDIYYYVVSAPNNKGEMKDYLLNEIYLK